MYVSTCIYIYVCGKVVMITMIVVAIKMKKIIWLYNNSKTNKSDLASHGSDNVNDCGVNDFNILILMNIVYCWVLMPP